MQTGSERQKGYRVGNGAFAVAHVSLSSVAFDILARNTWAKARTIFVRAPILHLRLCPPYRSVTRASGGEFVQ
jgi:hypothetical protein